MATLSMAPKSATMAVGVGEDPTNPHNVILTGNGR
jgi:hypothetical protein